MAAVDDGEPQHLAVAVEPGLMAHGELLAGGGRLDDEQARQLGSGGEQPEAGFERGSEPLAEAAVRVAAAG